MKMKNNFFLKRNKNESSDSKNKSKRVKVIEEISSEEDNNENKSAEESSDEESVQHKKLRIAKQYISKIIEEERDKISVDNLEAVRHRLKEEALEEAGRLIKKRAHEFENIVPKPAAVFKKHKLSLTALVVSPCEKYFFTSSKDSCIIKWDLVEKKKLQMIEHVKKGEEGPGHTNPVLALAISSDGKFLASGCEGKLIKIWSSDSLDLLKTFIGHKSAITGLVFQKGTNNLISSSKDRSLKIWNLDEMGYVETLFGHQDEVLGIDCCGDSVITCGSRDSTVRLWKILEETQLVYNGDGGSIDCIAVSSFQSFISGGEDGALRLWSTQRKKPKCKIVEAHGINEEANEPNWIVSITTLKNSDLIATGSKDGYVRFWRSDDEMHTLTLISKIPVAGFVNCMQFTPSGSKLIIGTGQEHRLGRWWRCKDATNAIIIYEF